MSETECPTCGREDFKSKEGMRSHHAKSHGDSLCYTTLICERCGDEYEKKKVRADKSKYCSTDCLTKSNGEKLQKEPVVVDCQNCGADVEKQPSQAKRDVRHFCDKDCLGEFRSGEDHHFWDGGPETVECEVCSVQIERETWHVEREGRDVCSRDCRYKLLEVESVGYIKDTGRYYTADWEKRREEVIDRDNGKCRACGVSREQSREQYGCDLHVHHVVPARKFKTVAEANQLSNLVSACQSCHIKYEGLPVFPM